MVFESDGICDITGRATCVGAGSDITGAIELKKTLILKPVTGEASGSSEVQRVRLAAC
jgi:hypothetical protein